MKMSNKKRNADKKPLMYIVQPDYAETTRSSMQEIVIKRKADKPDPPKFEEQQPAYPEKQQEEAMAAVQQADPKAAAEPVSQQTQEISEPESTKDQQQAEPEAVEETAEHEPLKAEKKEEPALEAQKPEKEPEAVHNAAKAEEKAPPARKVKKPMSKMSIHEKIDFLTKLPHNMPRALCLIEANGRTYRGVIVGRRNDSVLLRTTGNGAPTELAIDDITSLHPLGF
ncbi:spore coat protein [Bacillus tequilensis]|uniref:spore coat protein CotO n=1 Tax=Bacillus tequilensis TaxID=227866 RepID=UPI0015757CA9|nr:spore coat protein CotO [Bacillus tequilensis]NTU26733.1 spore coat protein [Bacillus tequilensis]